MLKEVIKLVKLDITTFLSSIAPIISLYILGGFIHKEIIGVFGLTYMFQFVWGMFYKGMNRPIFIYAFKDIKEDKDKTMSIVFSGLLFFILIEGMFYIISVMSMRQFLVLLAVDSTIIEICYLYAIYATAAIGLQLIDRMSFSFYEYTGDIPYNNKLSSIYTMIRIGSTVVYVLLDKWLILNDIAILSILLLPLLGFTGKVFMGVLKEINKYKIKFTWDFLNSFQYGIRDIIRGLMNVVGNFIGTRNINLAGTAISSSGSTTFQYAFISTITDVQWDCAGEASTLTSLNIASEPVKYKDIRQIHDKKVNSIWKSDLVASYIVLGIMTIFCFISVYIISFRINITNYMLINLILDIVGMIIATPCYILTAFLNALGRYKTLSIISIIGVAFRILASSIPSVYAVNIGMVVSEIMQIVLLVGILIWYRNKYRELK